jgi:ubiquinone/menaquinone biosynthesis C-methylase UbiE
MKVLDRIHEAYVHGRRVRRLSDHLVQMIPPACSLLDIGCGDGKLAHLLLEKRPDLRIEGVDVLLRKKTWLPVKPFDGINLPFAEASFDGAMLIDVLHHTLDPLPLLRQALRVSRRWVIVKDHVLSGPGAALRLRFMDYVGNARHRVALPYNYQSPSEWRALYQCLDVRVVAEVTDLGLYPRPFDYVFGAGLHFVALLESTVH